jgi:sigma-B regulation protein RsbU (phosphoserine phosphatase)
VLLLLTDGILERRDRAGEFFGLDRVRAVVREMQCHPAGAILDRLFETALTWGEGRPWEDDATIMVVKRAEAPAA